MGLGGGPGEVTLVKRLQRKNTRRPESGGKNRQKVESEATINEK